jgi:hypothetical protein
MISPRFSKVAPAPARYFPCFSLTAGKNCLRNATLLGLTVCGVETGEDLRAGAELGPAEPVELGRDRLPFPTARLRPPRRRTVNRSSRWRRLFPG